MSIFVSVEDKEGEQIGPVFELQSLQRHFPRLENSACLRFVSEIEDAAFNQAQLPLVVSELEALGGKTLKTEEKAELDHLIAACRKIAGQKGSSLRFYAERD